MSIIIKQPHLCTHIPVLEPRYHDKVALPLKRKVDFGTGVIIFTFPNSNAYKDGRYAMEKAKAQSYPVEDKGHYQVYAIPLEDFEPWESTAEIYETIERIFP